MKIVSLTISLLFISILSFSQTTAKGAAAPSPEDISVSALETADWSFYADEESETYFVDFEKININLSDIVVKKNNGDVVFKDDVVNLPVNAIYELDFAGYEKGDYVIELRSYTKIIRKSISIR